MYTTDYHSAIFYEILPCIEWIDLESIMLSKIKKNQRTQIVYDFIHVEYQKTKKQS